MPNDENLKVQNVAGLSLVASTLETIDTALVRYVDEDLNIYCDTNEGFNKVPVALAPQERAYQVKNDPSLRTSNNKMLIYPAIAITRNNIVKNPSMRGQFGVYIPPYYAYYKRGGAYEVARVINQEKTLLRANANSIRKSASKQNKNFQTFPGNNEKIVYDIISVPTPTYVQITYEVSIRTEYQQQMNEILSPFIAGSSTPSRFNISHNGNTFEASIKEDFTQNSSNSLETNERIFETAITIEVLGYLTGEGKNQSTPVSVYRQSAAEVSIGRERSILGDKPDFHVGKKDKYRSE